MSYSLHRGAERDLTEAFRFYKAEAGASVAGRFLKEFERVTKVLEDFPEIGTPTNEGRRTYPLRGFPYSIIYRSVDAGVRVLVVRHQSRDPTLGDDRS
ncbi:MAG TPA: type II toxin-antitoxin system RelE/ParE family toxin [Acidobacteria bacterium]|nr:type II toxin-antitoxin system RelE/ParE family toxin [Acidobacteriota bacterium]